jgi:hypothetical protein
MSSWPATVRSPKLPVSFLPSVVAVIFSTAAPVK